MLSYSYFNLHIHNKFYDATDVENPVKSKYEAIIIPTSSVGQTDQQFRIKKHYYRTNDWLSLFKEKGYDNFYSIDEDYTHSRS
mmetsp:Transcript_26114/g.23111  ORF Transcript_26114/g.23111 Transcript_26114/m.23111 type:complete len:83 (+) Transcript_26114:357-605(+)